MRDSSSQLDGGQVEAVVRGLHTNLFAILGMHRVAGQRWVRTFQPGASKVELLDRSGKVLASMNRLHAEGLFEVPLPPRLRRYRFRVTWSSAHQQVLEDPYSFPSTLGELDLYLLGEGSHQDIYRKLGAQPATLSGVKGTCFSVWAPNASRVSVVGDFNAWDGRRHVLRRHPANGIWEMFIPGVGPGAKYKFELQDRLQKLLPLKSDPLGKFHEPPPGNASIVYESHYQWQDQDWMSRRTMAPALEEPMSIYEVHLASWRRHDDGTFLSWQELAKELTAYVLDMGFTHVELMPVTEYPYDGSWGYQPVGLFAPTHRFGEPDGMRQLVDELHQAGIGVIVDWVPAHFPRDEHGLSRFDGTHLYEHADPRKGAHADWGTLIYNYGRREVINYLVGSALYWVRQFHVDAVRVDAVASMLYLDYSREDGEWLPNQHGGRENLEAVEFLHQLNAALHANCATSHAEESTAWPGVSHPVDAGGLGFSYKWNMGWMNDTLSYMGEEAVHRKHHHDKMTFGLVYAFNENFILPLSHDEVVHGKGSLVNSMSGDDWQKFANLRAYFGFMWAHPGKKLLFMGGEFAQPAEWNHDRSLDWHLLDNPLHQGMQELVRILNNTLRATPALYEQDFKQRGFEWIDLNDRDNSVFSWLRYAKDGSHVLCVSNFTPVVREKYRVGVPGKGTYSVLVNTDSEEFGGSGVTSPARIKTRSVATHGREHSIELTLPPLATMILKWS